MKSFLPLIFSNYLPVMTAVLLLTVRETEARGAYFRALNHSDASEGVKALGYLFLGGRVIYRIYVMFKD